MTATWMVLLYGDEKFWTSASAEVVDRVMREHRAYAAACAEQGYTMIGGEQLGFSSTAITARRSEGGPVEVTDGPFSETAEYLGGYYVFQTDDPKGLAELTGEMLITDTGGGAELRPVIQVDGQRPAAAL
ncbi:YciI family protein [Cellulomonas sp. URHD0024]|uniref:YciI family protein n=1 Tax=Cellulomonas sp. URHD0024 TaxID=1302620 RepID=UPI00040B455B|nr:YciI family protein [Cellulomonas sp. URHD0024]